MGKRPLLHPLLTCPLHPDPGYATEEEFDGTYRALLLARIWWSASLSFSAGQPQTVLIFFFRSTRNMAQVCHLSSVSVYATTDYTLCPKKHPRHFQLYLENQLPNFNNFWRKYSWHNLPSNDHSVVHLTQCMLLHYLGKADQPKYALNRKREKTSPTLSIVPRIKISRF